MRTHRIWPYTHIHTHRIWLTVCSLHRTHTLTHTGSGQPCVYYSVHARTHTHTDRIWPYTHINTHRIWPTVCSLQCTHTHTHTGSGQPCVHYSVHGDSQQQQGNTRQVGEFLRVWVGLVLEVEVAFQANNGVRFSVGECLCICVSCEMRIASFSVLTGPR